jgi:hypothetical protein
MSWFFDEFGFIGMFAKDRRKTKQHGKRTSVDFGAFKCLAFTKQIITIIQRYANDTAVIGVNI